MQLVDLLWPIYLLLGWEEVRIHPGDTVLTPLEFRHYPITHSLAGGIGWGLLPAPAAWPAMSRCGASSSSSC